jgi:16S rRNA A1518/A1519 N6-dimethyltransferase RsmA/KsgA/DIM1 with predicted DNA glycosylase/AP lyase activity
MPCTIARLPQSTSAKPLEKIVGNTSYHELIQSYLEQLYAPYAIDIKKSQFFYKNEQYGELYYYSFVKLLTYLQISPEDHVLDIGSGLGKIVFQLFLTTQAASVTGVEINLQRYAICKKIYATMQQQLPDMFANDRKLNILHGDFLNHGFSEISVIYVCSTVFSFDLLDAIGKKINMMPRVKKIASFRKLPHLSNFQLIERIFLHADWEKTPCYLYERSS